MVQEHIFSLSSALLYTFSLSTSPGCVLLESETNLTNCDISLNFNEVIKETHFQRYTFIPVAWMLLNREVPGILNLGRSGLSRSASLRVRLLKGKTCRLKQQRPLLWVEINWLKTWISYTCYSCQEKARREGTNIRIYQGIISSALPDDNKKKQTKKQILRSRLLFPSRARGLEAQLLAMLSCECSVSDLAVSAKKTLLRRLLRNSLTWNIYYWDLCRWAWGYVKRLSMKRLWI